MHRELELPGRSVYDGEGEDVQDRIEKIASSINQINSRLDLFGGDLYSD